MMVSATAKVEQQVISLCIDESVYEVSINPVKINGEKRLIISLNSGEDHIYAWIVAHKL